MESGPKVKLQANIFADIAGWPVWISPGSWKQDILKVCELHHISRAEYVPGFHCAGRATILPIRAEPKHIVGMDGRHVHGNLENFGRRPGQN
jgi:hypothetical protein